MSAEKRSSQLFSFPTKFVLRFLMRGSINEQPGAGMHTATAGCPEGPLRSNSSCHGIGRQLQTFASVERMHGAALLVQLHLVCDALHTLSHLFSVSTIFSFCVTVISQASNFLCSFLLCSTALTLSLCIPFLLLSLFHIFLPFGICTSQPIRAVRFVCWTKRQNRSNKN